MYATGITKGIRTGSLALVLAVTLSGCLNVELPKFGRKDAGQEAATASAGNTTQFVERDVEAPSVFQATDTGLWDGRPSLGGVWVAYPGKIQPERVVIRNEENQKFVIGALFKRERDNPGPRFQLSSDAAAALGVLAGKPVVLNVTALQRQNTAEAAAESDGTTPAPDAAKDGKSKDIGAIATTAIDKAENNTPTTQPTATPPKPATYSKLDKPFIQIGIFSVEENARNTATSMRTQGIQPIVKAHKLKGRKYWRVIIGPAPSKGERGQLLKKARQMGFADAYFVTN